VTIRVGVIGAGGKMGSTVCQAVAADPALDLVVGVDPHHADLDLARVASVPGVEGTVARDVEGLVHAGVEVAVDFTHLEAARGNLLFLAEHGIHGVVGTTGFSDEDLADFRRAFTSSNCVIAPNFAIGAILMMHMAALAAPWFETGEIIELHHDSKVDAPSGTAMLTAERMVEASDQWGDDPTQHELAVGARGGEGPGGLHIHSVRLRGLVAHQEVLLGTTGQSLSIRHDSYDRTSFMPGVLLAVKQVPERAGITVGLDSLLGF
jgi:4-hydroxy-tetrahydrodipicolinate reductase